MYDFVESFVGLPNEEFPVVSVGKARERLGSSRVHMENDKNSQENREGELVKSKWPEQHSSGSGCPSRSSC